MPIAASNLHHVPEHADRLVAFEPVEVVFAGPLAAFHADLPAVAVVAAVARRQRASAAATSSPVSSQPLSSTATTSRMNPSVSASARAGSPR